MVLHGKPQGPKTMPKHLPKQTVAEPEAAAEHPQERAS